MATTYKKTLANMTVVLYSMFYGLTVFKNSVVLASVSGKYVPKNIHPFCETIMTNHPSKSFKRQPTTSAGRNARRAPAQLSRGAMVADICLVAVWGATIPGLMWLGVAGGF